MRYFKANMNKLIYIPPTQTYIQRYLQINKKIQNNVATVGVKIEKQK